MTNTNISKKLADNIDITVDFFNNDIVTTGLFDDPDTGINAIRNMFLSKGAAKAKLLLVAAFMAAPLDKNGGIVIPNRDDIIAKIPAAKRAIKNHRMFIHVVDFDADTRRVTDGFMGHPVTSVLITR